MKEWKEDIDDAKDEIFESILEKLNVLLKDQEFRDKIDYYFEPNTSNAPYEEIFTFHNPFTKKNIQFTWNRLKRKIEGPTDSFLEILDQEALIEFRNALEHFEVKMRHRPTKKKKMDFLDFFEDEKIFVVALEIPQTIPDDEIEITGSSHEIEILVGETFKKIISIPPQVDPDSASATFENNILEIKLQKVINEPKKKIEIQKNI